MGNVTISKNTSSLIICHQNIRDLVSKKDKLNMIMLHMSINPHLICLSEHHLKTLEITKYTLNSYKIFFVVVWLTVHRSSMWIKRPTRCHF